MIKAVIFDMDGVLIDSEPIWRKTYIHVFKSVGLALTEAMCREVTGFRVDMVVDHWFRRYPWEGIPKQVVEEMIWEYIIQFVKEEGRIKTGAREGLEFIKAQHVKIGLASTSAMALIDVVIDKLQLKEYFEAIHSGEFEAYPKPHPGIYLTTAHKLGIEPTSCLAIEDSITGMIAAKAANMRCLAVPDEVLIHDRRISIADMVCGSLAELDSKVWNALSF